MRHFGHMVIVLITLQVILIGILLYASYQTHLHTSIKDERMVYEAAQALVLEQQRILAYQNIDRQRLAQEQQLLEHTSQATLPTIYTDDTQFVMMSFDGSRSLSTWQQTLDFARQQQTRGVPIAFTYFISGVYFLPEHQKHFYDLSWRAPGDSDISFGDSSADTDTRIAFVNQAHADGHEIGSHLNGHFDGGDWSEDQWDEEISMFKNIIGNTLPNQVQRGTAFDFDAETIVGMRTPLLSKNPGLYAALSNNGFAYDASGVGTIGTQPWKDAYGLWHFPLARVTINGKNTLSMDYNLYLAQTNARDILTRGTLAWESAKQDIVDTYMDYFEQEYDGTRAPINIGHHFSMWNDGVYWEALKEFSQIVCGKENVACTTYGDLVAFLESSQE